MRPRHMKGKLILLTILTLLFIGYVGFNFLSLDSKNALGKLEIVSTPNTNVFLDNVNVGRTPFELDYKIGDYQVKLIPDKEASQTATWQGKVSVYKNLKTYVVRELGDSDLTSSGAIFTIEKPDPEKKKSGTGQLFVETDPVGAIIDLDTDEKGVAPILLAELPTGTHELSVTMPGFVRRTHKVNVIENMKVRAQIKLPIDREAQKKQASDTAKLNEKKATDSAMLSPTPISPTPSKKTVMILQTPTGFLRVRAEPNVNASESARVTPGEKFTVLEEQTNWYKISFAEGKEGWIAAQYARVEE